MTSQKIPVKSTESEAKPKTKPAHRAVKTLGRKDRHLCLLPAAIGLSEEEIALRSYFPWESRGIRLGSWEEDWYKARMKCNGLLQLRQQGKR
jgi:hypothetical protein